MEKIKAFFIGKTVSSNSQEAFSLYKKNNLGEKIGEKIQYSMPEVIFLLEKGKMEVFLGNKRMSIEKLFKKIEKVDRRINIKYLVFKNLREKGYIVKTALKFGSDFRVYEKGLSPGKEHSKWIVFCNSESERFSWHEFAAKSRVAHSTKKNLLLAIVDEEGGISYYEVKWIKP